MENTDIFRDYNFADALVQKHLGISIKELVKNHKKAEAESRRVEAEKKELEAEKIKNARTLIQVLGFPIEKTAKLLRMEIGYIESILDKKPEKTTA